MLADRCRKRKGWDTEKKEDKLENSSNHEAFCSEGMSKSIFISTAQFVSVLLETDHQGYTFH